MLVGVFIHKYNGAFYCKFIKHCLVNMRHSPDGILGVHSEGCHGTQWEAILPLPIQHQHAI